MQDSPTCLPTNWLMMFSENIMTYLQILNVTSAAITGKLYSVIKRYYCRLDNPDPSQIFPHQQKHVLTFITHRITSVLNRFAWWTDQRREKLYYLNDGKKTEVKRITIVSSLTTCGNKHQSAGKGKIRLKNWMWNGYPPPAGFTASVNTLPVIRHPMYPRLFYLNEVTQINIGKLCYVCET